nr:AAA family ATPase [uncultured Cohaesibacter sp.]
MFLKKITLKNFRQFYGEQEITFADDPGKNVTLLHAENGIGKTTFLNSLLWCFYKTLTDRFENPTDIVNHEAVREGDHEAKVEVLFKHKGKEYRVCREIDQKFSQEDFKAWLIESGNHSSIPNPNVFIQSVVPQEMSEYFFFDGEYAETLASRQNKKAVKTALENMLGCNIAIQAQEDLRSIKKAIEKEKGSLASNNSLGETWQTKLEKLESERDADQKKLKILEQNVEFTEIAVKEISNGLRSSEGAKEVQKTRDSLEAKKQTAQQEEIKSKVVKTKWIDEFSIGLLSQKAMDACSSYIEDANVKGQLPSKIAEDFVNDILESKTCICGRPFEPESSEASQIKALLAEAGSRLMNDRLMNIRTLMGNLDKSRNLAIGKFQEIDTQLVARGDEINKLEAEIKECSLKLQNSNIVEIAEREEALEKKKNELIDFKAEIKHLEQICEQRAHDIKVTQEKRDKHLAKDHRAKGLTRKTDILDATIARLDDELNTYRNDSRAIIASKVNKILEEAARRDYYVEIDEAFNLDMFHGTGKTPVGKSGGENQLLSLAFIASLISFASDRREEENKILKPGTMAPLMLDSPFGQLDVAYRESTAKFLPALAEQVVLLVSQSQGDEKVIKALGDKIGAEYVLVSENKSSRGDKPSDILDLYGKEYQCSLYDCDRDMTRIQEVKR